MAKIIIREIYIDLRLGKLVSVRFDVEANGRVESYAVRLYKLYDGVSIMFAKLKNSIPLDAWLNKPSVETTQWYVDIGIYEFPNATVNKCNVALPHVSSTSVIPCSDSFFNEILTKIEQVMQSIEF